MGADHAGSDGQRSSRAELAAAEFIATREQDGEDVPTPLTERKYSGTFLVRTLPALHARLTVEAAEQNVSMNHWAVLKLEDRLPTGLFDL